MGWGQRMTKTRPLVTQCDAWIQHWRRHAQAAGPATLWCQTLSNDGAFLQQLPSPQGGKGSRCDSSSDTCHLPMILIWLHVPRAAILETHQAGGGFGWLRAGLERPGRELGLGSGAQSPSSVGLRPELHEEVLATVWAARGTHPGDSQRPLCVPSPRTEHKPRPSACGQHAVPPSRELQ